MPRAYLKCEPLNDKIEVPNNVVYEDIFKNADKQLEAVKVIQKMLREIQIQMITWENTYGIHTNLEGPSALFFTDRASVLQWHNDS